MTTDTPAQARLLSKVATLSGAVRAEEESRKRAVQERNAAMVEAQNAGATYLQLGAATGLAKVGVYKALASAKATPGE